MNIPAHVRAEVDKLLGMYAEYKKLNDAQAVASRALAKARLKQQPTHDLEQAYRHTTEAIRQVSDAMTFASPLIWAMYKYEAYAEEAQPIRTMQDFRVHCSKPGYICTKRFDFVNNALDTQDLPNLSNTKLYPDTAELTTAYNTLNKLGEDTGFKRKWGTHEYYKVEGNVAKWENFSSLPVVATHPPQN